MTNRSHATGPLQGVTVIDCTQALAGPFGTAILADLGADVIKIEPPRGDMARANLPRPPNYVHAAEGAGAEEVDFGGYFASINRNKRSIALDLKQAADRDVLLAMCEQADVVVENSRAGVMDRLGLGYETIRERNPRIVYGACRGFGDPRTGESPYANRPAFDIIAQSMGGLAYITGPEEGQALGYPSGSSVGDLYPGTLLALGITAAVFRARESGVGQFFDVSMYDGVLFLCEAIVQSKGFGGPTLGPRGDGHPILSPFGLYPASDGGVAIAAPGEAHWALLCDAMGRADLVDDERTRNTFKRKQHQMIVDGAIAEWTSTRTRAEVVAALDGKVPCGPVNTGDDIFEDPHVAIREMIVPLDLPGDAGPAAVVGNPLKFTETPTGIYRRPPRLDEHRAEVLAQFALADPSCQSSTEGD